MDPPQFTPHRSPAPTVDSEVDQGEDGPQTAPSPPVEEGSKETYNGRFLLVAVTIIIIGVIILAFLVTFLAMDTLDQGYDRKRFVGRWEITTYGMYTELGYANITAEDIEMFIDLTFSTQGNLDIFIDVDRGIDIEEHTYWELKGDKVDISACYTIPWLSFEGPLGYQFMDDDKTMLLMGSMGEVPFVYTLEKV